MKRMATYTSCMHVHVRYYVYEPKVVLRSKGVVQIHHGLGEHADRYDHFASFLLDQGFVVVVSDFVGHGKSLIDFEQGYFGKDEGVLNLVKDMHHLQNIMRKHYPDVPYFMLGTDLGSVLIRKYASLYGDFIDGIILLGTPSRVDRQYTKKSYLYLMKTIKGPLYKSQGYFNNFHQAKNKAISQHETEVDWLTSDALEIRKYLNDPMTHFVYTIQGYRDIIEVMNDVNNDETIRLIPKHLAIYIGAGEYDSMTKNNQHLVDKYKKANISDVQFFVFKNMRHALLFENKKRDVYFHILKWLNERTYL